MRLLIVTHDQTLQCQLKPQLTQAGFAVDAVDSEADAEVLGDMALYDAAVLDPGVDVSSALQLIKAWRRRGNTLPVVLLTTQDAWHERVEGFYAGADDSLGKPFHMAELVARLNAVIRRSKAQIGGVLRRDGLTLDEVRQTVMTANGRLLALTGMEFRLLRYFMLHPGQVLSKSQLSTHVYDDEAEKMSNIIEVYVSRLRQKCGQHLIHTRRGQGYVFGRCHNLTAS